MNYRYFFVFLMVLFFSSMVFSYSVGFDYAHVRSSSYPNYLDYQYAHYYDNIDLRYSVYGSGITSPVTFIVSPKVYGITNTGQRVFVHNIQTHSFVMHPSSVYVYSYNPMFSFDPAYQTYEVLLDLQSSDGSYYNSTSRYIYSQGTNPNPSPDPDPSVDDPEFVTCDDFSLSGMQDIYLEEDSRDYYNLYLVNSVNVPLTITSVTTSPTNPGNLDIEDITYPYTLSPLQTKSAQIELFSDTVSSNYSSSFQVNVRAKYNNSLTCEKTYQVNYRITDSELENNGSCNDIRILDDYFKMSDNSSENFEIEVENSSLDYYFEVEDIDVDTKPNSIIDVSLKNSLNKIYSDESEFLKLNVSSEDTSFYKTEIVDLEITGYLKRNNRADKKCRIREDVSIRISPDSSSSNNSSECEDVKIYTRDVMQGSQLTKSYSLKDGFYIYNGSNKKFTVTGVDYKDNSMYADILSKSFDYSVYPSSSNPLNFDIRTSSVTENKTSKAQVSIKGNFEGGVSCKYTDVSSNFNLTVTKENDLCSNIGIYDSTFVDGDNYFTIYNNTNKKFTVNNLISQNLNNANVNVIDSAFTLSSNSQQKFRVGASGQGDFTLKAKGAFSDGVTCDYSQTTSGYFARENGLNFADDSCEFNFDYPNTKYISLDGDSLNFSFRNLTNKSGKITVSAVGGVVQDPVIKFSAYANIDKQVNLVNIKNPKMVLYTVEVYGCSKKSYFTNLYPLSSQITGEVSFLTYPGVLSSTKNKFISSFSLKNSSLSSKEVEVKFSGFPESFNFVVSSLPLNPNVFSSADNQPVINVNPNSTKNVYFGVMVLGDLDFKKYNGYLEIYDEGKQISKQPFSIDRSLTASDLIVKTSLQTTDLKNTVLLTFILDNKLSDSPRELYLSFEDENNFVIDGNRNMVVLPSSTLERSYTLTYKEGSLFKYNLVDTNNSSLAHFGEIDLKDVKEKPNILSGFFTLSNTRGFIFAFVLILLIALIIFLIIAGDKTRHNKKQVINDPVVERKVLPSLKEEKVLLKEEISLDLKKENEMEKSSFKPGPTRKITLGELN